MAFELWKKGDQISEMFRSILESRDIENIMGASWDLGTKAAIDKENRIIEITVSSDQQDRDGDVIKQEGIIHDFAKSVLYAHDYRDNIPIGKIIDYRIAKRKGMKVTIEKHQFPELGKHDLSDQAFNMIEFGALNAASIGFIPLITTRIDSEEERQRLGLGPYGMYFEKIEQLETSWVPVQSNREAIREAYGKGIVKPELISKLFPEAWKDLDRPEYWAVDIDLEEKAPEDSDVESVQFLIDLIETLNKKIGGFETQLEALTVELKTLKPQPDRIDISEIEAEQDASLQIDEKQLDESFKEIVNPSSGEVTVEGAKVIVSETLTRSLVDVVTRAFKKDHLGIIDPDDLKK